NSPIPQSAQGASPAKLRLVNMIGSPYCDAPGRELPTGAASRRRTGQWGVLKTVRTRKRYHPPTATQRLRISLNVARPCAVLPPFLQADHNPRRSEVLPPWMRGL